MTHSIPKEVPEQATEPFVVVPGGHSITGVTGTTCLVDWLRFTLPESPNALEQAMSLVGEERNWRQTEGGRMGYSYTLRRGSVVMYQSRDGNRVCVDLSGAGCRQLEKDRGLNTEEDWQKFLGGLVSAGASFPRVDWALDDQAGLLDMAIIMESVRAGNFTSRFRTVKALDVCRGVDGPEIRCGSRNSESYVRIYHKGLQLAAQRKAVIGKSSVRAEIETKDRQAAALVRQFMALGAPAITSDLLARLAFRIPARSRNKGRWLFAPWWLAFLGTDNPARVVVVPQKRSVADDAAWIESQCIPAIARLWESADYGPSWFSRRVSEYRERQTQHQRECHHTEAVGRPHPGQEI